MTLTGLHANSRYYIRAIARTSGTSGSWQSDPPTVFTTAQNITVPGAPRNLNVERRIGGEATLSWLAPTSNGGANITRYEVALNNGAWISVGTATSHVFRGLASGTHTLRVRAVNSQGAGAQANATAQFVAVTFNPTVVNPNPTWVELGDDVFNDGDSAVDSIIESDSVIVDNSASETNDNGNPLDMSGESPQENEYQLAEEGCSIVDGQGEDLYGCETQLAIDDHQYIGIAPLMAGPLTLIAPVGIAIGYGNIPNPGFTFTGWFTAANVRITGSFIPSGNVTAYARINWITVSFNTNGGGANPAPRLRAPYTVFGTDIPPTPTRARYTFVAWYDTPAQTGGTRLSPGFIVTNDVTFWARWRQNTITISFNSMGGTPVADRSIVPGNSIGYVPRPQRVQGQTIGQYFLGWFTHRTSGQRVEPDFVPEVDIELFAHWTCSISRFPERLHDSWWPTNSVPLGTFTIPSGFTNWRVPMVVGMGNWNNHPDSPVSFYVTPASNNAVVLVAPGIGQDFGSYECFGHAGFIIRLYTNRIYSYAQERGISLDNVITSVMAHELGHAVGLADRARNPVREDSRGFDNSSIMSGNRDRNIVRIPTVFDIASVRLIYD